MLKEQIFQGGSARSGKDQDAQTKFKKK